MEITQAVPQDLIEVLYLLKVCVANMNEKGQKHWNNAYPGTNFMIEAIENNSLYIYKDLGIAKGLVVLSNDQPKEYEEIDWKGKGDKILFLRFLTIHPDWQDQDIAKSLIEFSEEFAKTNNYNIIRVDIFSGVESAQQLYLTLGFNTAGEFHTQFQKKPYLAYEKSL
jgi:GNAT superfamily N-acetyltransferase